MILTLGQNIGRTKISKKIKHKKYRYKSVLKNCQLYTLNIQGVGTKIQDMYSTKRFFDDF